METWEGDAYCVKCKEKREMLNGVVKISDSGRRMAIGECPDCGTKLSRILGKADEHELTENTDVVTETEEQRLRRFGYMTSDEFVDRLTPGLKEYLQKNWGRRHELLHPEDLASNASIYLEIAYHVFADFGVNNEQN